MLSAQTRGAFAILLSPSLVLTTGAHRWRHHSWLARPLHVANVAGSVGIGHPFRELHGTSAQYAVDASPMLDDGPMAIDPADHAYVAGTVQSGGITAHDLSGTHLLVRVEALVAADEAPDPMRAEQAAFDRLATVRRADPRVVPLMGPGSSAVTG